MADQQEKNKAIVRRWNEEPNTGKVGVYDELAASNYTFHGTPPSGIKELKAGMAQWRAGFPDLRIMVDDVIAEGDKVALHYTACGTHKGPIFGVAPTGKQVTITGISFCRMAGGKIVDDYAAADFLGMLQQIGAVGKFG